MVRGCYSLAPSPGVFLQEKEHRDVAHQEATSRLAFGVADEDLLLFSSPIASIIGCKGSGGPCA